MDLYTVKLHLSIYKWQNIKEYYIKTQLHYQSGTTLCESNYEISAIYYFHRVTNHRFGVKAAGGPGLAGGSRIGIVNNMGNI